LIIFARRAEAQGPKPHLKQKVKKQKPQRGSPEEAMRCGFGNAGSGFDVRERKANERRQLPG
jgi:hypothetical protein